jgi:hypothetical protein
MIRQYCAQRSRTVQLMCSGRVIAKQVGTIPIGTILYIQDQVRPLRPLESSWRPEPWMVEAWLPRDYARLVREQWRSFRIAAGHLAQVRSLRDCRRVRLVAAWILLQCLDAGLEKA